MRYNTRNHVCGSGEVYSRVFDKRSRTINRRFSFKRWLSDKENSPLVRFVPSFCKSFVSCMPVSNRLIFTEPYMPEKGEFKPVSIVMGIRFGDVCNGPPWTVNDAIDIARRREIEDVAQGLQQQSVQDGLSIMPRQTFKGSYSGESGEKFARMLLTMMEPEDDVLEYARTFTHLAMFSEGSIPLTYVRTKIPFCYGNVFLDEYSATHLLQLTSTDGQSLVIPVHDIVLVAQCLRISTLVTLETNHRKKGNVKPVFMVKDVPHLESFWILLKWLYSNDEDELYDSLEKRCFDGDEMLFGFVQNCRFWGVIDLRVFAVLRAFVEARFGVLADMI